MSSRTVITPLHTGRAGRRGGLLLLLFIWAALGLHAEDGSRLWLRGDMPKDITLKIDPTMPDDDGYRISGRTVTARTELGLLYGRYALLRGEQGESHPYFKLRILNHWDNLDGSIERGYAGKSIFWDLTSDKKEPAAINRERIERYAEANASIGINGTVLNNVNASPKMLTRPYINKVKEIADILRPWGIRVYLSVNFGSPKALGDLPTADPLNKRVQQWWQRKAKEIYQLIPDFGGFSPAGQLAHDMLASVVIERIVARNEIRCQRVVVHSRHEVASVGLRFCESPEMESRLLAKFLILANVRKSFHRSVSSIHSSGYIKYVLHGQLRDAIVEMLERSEEFDGPDIHFPVGQGVSKRLQIARTFWSAATELRYD